MVELGCVDKHFDVAMLARFLVQPHEGHLQQALHILAYLKAHNKSTMVYNDMKATIAESRFVKQDWREFYQDAKKNIQLNAPGNTVQLNCFVDADHAGDHITHCSHTGVLIFANRAPIIRLLKQQNTAETLTFGSEFVALKIATEMIKGLRYKL